MDAFYQRLSVRAATIDEVLSDALAGPPDPTLDAELASRRLAAWRQSCAAGDPSLFARRLARDGLSAAAVESRFAAKLRRPIRRGFKMPFGSKRRCTHRSSLGACPLIPLRTYSPGWSTAPIG
jgi:hypothetical protein